MGAKRDALAAYRRALEILEALSAADPADHRLQANLVDVSMITAVTLRELGLLDEAVRTLVRAVASAEALVRNDPASAAYKDQLAWCLDNLGAVQVWSSRPDEAVRAQERALAIREALARDNPSNLDLRINEAWSHNGLSSALDASGRTAEALRHIAVAVEVYEGLVRDHPKSARIRRSLAACLTTLGILQSRVGVAESRRSIERSVAIHEGLAREQPTSSQAQYMLVESTLCLATEQAAAGRPDEALANVRKAERIAERFPEVNKAQVLYNLACAYSQCSASVCRGVEDLGQVQREQYADRAMAALRQAVTAGFADVALLRRDLDLDPLRPRREFQNLLLDLSFPADSFRR
jgi:tetratricopeptide (TPR) repeat protein